MFNIDKLKEESKEEVIPSPLQEKLLEEEKEAYEGWLNDPITQKMIRYFEKEITNNTTRLVNKCMVTNLEHIADGRTVLYHSLKNKVIKEVLKILAKPN